ncbi:MAG TPA: hypothetical protein V6C65_33170, partial [Allocoleopsis sp.]
LLMAIVRTSPPLLTPLTGLTVIFSMLGMMIGIRRTRAALGTASRRRAPSAIFQTFGQTLLGTVYMLHWIPIMASTTARMSIRPKRLKWVKTVHHGSEDLWVDVTKVEVSPIEVPEQVP